MKTRTDFKIYYDGVIRCWCGCVTDFAKDISEFVIPMLDYEINAEFNGKKRTITKYDNVDRICEKFMEGKF